MHRSGPTAWALLAGLFMLPAAQADADDSGRGRTVSLSEAGELQLQVPEGWRQTQRPDDSRGVRTFEFHPAGGQDFLVLVSAGRAGERGNPRLWVERAKREAEGQSVEGKLAVQSLCAGEDSGFFFSATDRAPKPGEYRLMTQGVVRHDAYAVTFTVLSNGDQGQPKQNALRMLRELCDSSQSSEPPAARAPERGSGRSEELQIPGAPWSLHLDLSGFKIDLRNRRRDGKGEMLQGQDRATGIVLSAFVLKESDSPTSDECLERYWIPVARSSEGLTDVRRGQRGDMAIGEYTIELGDGAMHNRHMNAYIGAEGGCVDVHLSTMSRGDIDESLFTETLERVSLR
jgi:hypothetical protein